MPRKQVYGKRANATPIFSSSTVFMSSPAKAATVAKGKIEEVEEIEDLMNRLDGLEIESSLTKASVAKKTVRKALKTRDGNVAVPQNRLPVEEPKKQLKLRSKPPEAKPNKKPTPPFNAPKDQIVLQQPSALEAPRPELNAYSTHVKPLLDLCSDPAARKIPTPFKTWAAHLDPHFNIAKIAEASYGEVYRLSLKESIPGFTKADESVLKVIALKPPSIMQSPHDTEVVCERISKKEKAKEEKIAWMSSVSSVVSEVKLLQRMTPVPGFTNFREMRVLQGRPAPSFVAAWKAFNKSRASGQKSIFPDPGKKGSYDDTQLWAVVEMQDAGTDLENVMIEDIWSVWDVFWGVALAVGKGEEGMRFEHRDLHLGNICIRSRCPNDSLSSPSVRTTRRKLGFTGLETTIIDYTLSRADMDDVTTTNIPCPASAEPEVAFLDLELDPAIFEGDAAEEYQYEIYRYMRASMYLLDPLADLNSRWEEAQSSGHAWRGFHPQTNLLWLHFVLFKLLENMMWPSCALPLGQIPEGERKGAKRKALKLEKILGQLQELLQPETLSSNGLGSVRDLVAVALLEGWLDEEDVLGLGVEGEGKEESAERG
ncbi:hypothetical protein AOQ84DRAFT_384795 [Glonium stellatum]|uniref:non-specific serine/threonine protein kinase n=1 Tax=Glonium stellatum TaxID=574774 RepID=A0A8E2JYY4_9PEZI|nr:hypothetical protein AOQ84DRAFT_384795 [Glonium stellatum]